ncbi:MAG TPA: PH domain-containing protein [Candidatus Glassbacteria bacterium]|nr:PH domain-containing protein [Candidatus Glassbacteria bacterium]
MVRVSEIRPDFQPPQEEVIDRPTPGGGYVAIIVILVGGALAVSVWQAWKTYLVNPRTGYALAVPALIIGTLFFLVLHAAFFTKYRIDSDTLDIKSGLFRGKLPLTRIREISRSQFNWRVLGWGFRQRGFCNRFTDGVKLITEKESIYASPTNPQLFMSQLRTLRFSKIDPDKKKH